MCCSDTAAAKAAAECSKEYRDQTGDRFEGKTALSYWREVPRCAAERQEQMCALGSCERDSVSGLKGHRLILALPVRAVVSVIIFAGINGCMTVM